ncbi:hypothetical protein C7S13_7077 [Burkholderia cepacia]|nr:hypothetical protein [Burkholderia cepacia]
MIARDAWPVPLAAPARALAAAGFRPLCLPAVAARRRMRAVPAIPPPRTRRRLRDTHAGATICVTPTSAAPRERFRTRHHASPVPHAMPPCMRVARRRRSSAHPFTPSTRSPP